MLILVGFDTSFVKKIQIFSKKFINVQNRVPKTKSAPFFDEKCLFKFSNVHLVGIHVQKALHLQETGGGKAVESTPPAPGSPRRFQTMIGIGLIEKFHDLHRVERRLLLLINLESC